MRRSSVLFHLLGAVGLVGLLGGCSGGGDSGTTPVAAPATPTISSGTITKFGSVYINDRKYELDDSTLTSVDGSDSVKGDVEAKKILKLGMVVRVSGTASGSSRTASTITQEDTLEGPIDSVDVLNSRFVLLGQTVLVDDTTKFDTGVSLGNLAAGQVVEVSGFVKADGIVAASFIERKPLTVGCTLGCEVKGTVKNHVHGTTTFQIGGLTVYYATAMISDMPAPNGSNWDTLFVEVKGTVFTAGTLTATVVEPEGFQAPNGNQVEIEGFVTSVLGTGHFMLGMTEVQAGNAIYVGGMIDEVAMGQKLEVEGTISNNVITATKVKFQDAVRIESNVAFKPNTTSLTLDGLPGITVVVNSQTEFKNVADLAGIAVGNNVRVRGRQGAGNTVVATEVELRSVTPDNKVSLQGVVQDVVQSLTNETFITILGINIDTTGFQLRGTDDSLVSQSTFFSSLKPDTTLVKVKGRLISAVVTWREAELED